MIPQEIIQMKVISLQQAQGNLNIAKDIFAWLSEDTMKKEEERIVAREKQALDAASAGRALGEVILRSGTLKPFEGADAV